jgi:L-2-hydroxyglutarate oxidase
VTRQRVAVVGGGILGVAVARRLLEVSPDSDVAVLEKERELALHQTGRNSGVVHAGLYYPPGSLKARLCRRGVSMLHEFCRTEGLPYREIGKVLVALDEVELGRLDGILERATANGVPGVRIIGPDELRELEPNVRGTAALHSPTTAIVDYRQVTLRLAADVERRGGHVRTAAEVTALRAHGGEVVVTADGHGQAYDQVVICAGLQADRVAALAGDTSAPQIVPFRGEYHRLRPERQNLVRGLVYPVPDPRYPFLGVHLTPRVDGEVLVGPNAVLALAREGYTWRDVSPRDLSAVARYSGFRRFAAQHWRTGLCEMRGSLSKRVFAEAARRYVPELTVDDLLAGPAGVRAQALDPDGTLVEDFRVTRRGNVAVVRNAPSPAATSSLAIAEHVVDLIRS